MILIHFYKPGSADPDPVIMGPDPQHWQNDTCISAKRSGGRVDNMSAIVGEEFILHKAGNPKNQSSQTSWRGGGASRKVCNNKVYLPLCFFYYG